MRLMLALIASLLMVVPASAQEAKNHAEFCQSFFGVCLRGCPSGSCLEVCRERRAACRQTGCFEFRSPGPRCFANAADRALTDLRLAPDPEQARRGRSRAQ